MEVINLKPEQYYKQTNNGTVQDSDTGITVYAKDACMPTARIMFYLGNGFQIPKTLPEPWDVAITKLLISREAVEFCRVKYPWAGRIPPNEVHGMYGSWLDHKIFGNRLSDFKENISFDQMCEYMDKRKVIMTSGRFQGVTGPIEGHAVCFVGINDMGELLIADPYGDPWSNYKSKNGYLVPMTSIEYSKHIKPLGVHNTPSGTKWGHVTLGGA